MVKQFICLASHPSEIDTRSFYSEDLGAESFTRVKTHALLDNAGHRINRCDVNYASLLSDLPVYVPGVLVGHRFTKDPKV